MGRCQDLGPVNFLFRAGCRTSKGPPKRQKASQASTKPTILGAGGKPLVFCVAFGFGVANAGTNSRMLGRQFETVFGWNVTGFCVVFWLVWLAGCLVDFGWLGGWLFWLVGGLAGWFVVWWFGCLIGWLVALGLHSICSTPARPTIQRADSNQPRKQLINSGVFAAMIHCRCLSCFVWKEIRRPSASCPSLLQRGPAWDATGSDWNQ